MTGVTSLYCGSPSKGPSFRMHRGFSWPYFACVDRAPSRSSWDPVDLWLFVVSGVDLHRRRTVMVRMTPEDEQLGWARADKRPGGLPEAYITTPDERGAARVGAPRGSPSGAVSCSVSADQTSTSRRRLYNREGRAAGWWPLPKITKRAPLEHQERQAGERVAVGELWTDHVLSSRPASRRSSNRAALELARIGRVGVSAGGSRHGTR